MANRTGGADALVGTEALTSGAAPDLRGVHACHARPGPGAALRSTATGAGGGAAGGWNCIASTARDGGRSEPGAYAVTAQASA